MTREDQWIEHCAEAVLWYEESDLEVPEWLIREARRIGRRSVSRVLSRPGLPYDRYAAGLFVAELAGMN